MSNQRTPEDICLLCKRNKSDKKGSHFTPIGILKKVIGKRGAEHEVTIDPFKGQVSEYFGRDNLKNTDPTIRQSDNVADYIFCTDCEKKLGIIEGECIDKLHSFSENLLKGALQIKKTQAGNTFFRFKKTHKNIVTLFFYSVIWRQILNDSLSHKVQFSPLFIEALRQIVYQEINNTLADIENSANFQNYPQLIVYTTYHNSVDPTGFTYGPNSFPSNPRVFTTGIYETLIFTTHIISEHFSLTTKLPKTLVDRDLVINSSQDGIIGVIDLKIWKTKTKWYYTKAADDFITTYVNQIVEATTLNFQDAKMLLKAETHLIAEKTKAKDYATFFTEAVDNVIKKNSN